MSRPSIPAGAFSGASLASYLTAGDDRWAAKNVTIDGVTQTVAEWIAALADDAGSVGQTDITPPTITGAWVDGVTLQVNFNEPIKNTGGTAGMTVTVNGVDRAIVGATIPASNTTALVVVLASAVVSGDVVLFNYDANATGSALTDLAGNEKMTTQASVENLTEATTATPITMDFEAGTYTGGVLSDITVARASNALHNDVLDAWSQFTNNTLALTNRGLLIQPAATNLHPNPTVTGGVVGNLATSGALPTGMEFSGTDNGLATASYVGRGTEGVLEYFDIDLTSSGADAVYIGMTTSTAINGVSGETFTGSFFVRIVSGTWPGGSLRLTMSERTSAGAPIVGAQTVAPVTPSTTRQRVSVTRTFNQPTAAKALLFINFDMTAAISGTGMRVRIYLPNIVKSGTLTTPMRGASRAADVVTIGGNLAAAIASATSLQVDTGSGLTTVTSGQLNTILNGSNTLLKKLVVNPTGGGGGTPGPTPPTSKDSSAIWMNDWSLAQPVERLVAMGNPVQYWLAGDARQSYNLSGTSDHLSATVQVRSGDLYSVPGWTDPTTSERTELFYANPATGDLRFHGLNEDCAFEFYLTPTGGANVTRWCVITQVHAGAAIDGPALELTFRSNDRLTLVTRYKTTSQVETERWKDPLAWARGARKRIRLEWRINSNVTGYVRLWVDGVQVLNWTGAIGATSMTGGRLSFGCYRYETPETFIGKFEPLGVKFGSHSTFAAGATP